MALLSRPTRLSSTKGTWAIQPNHPNLRAPDNLRAYPHETHAARQIRHGTGP